MPGRIIGVSKDAEGTPALPHGAADARAAHPPREGDEQHLHRAGAAGGDGRHVRRLSRARGAARDRAARARARPRCSARGARRSWATTLGDDAVLRHAARRASARSGAARHARRARERARINLRAYRRRLASASRSTRRRPRADVDRAARGLRGGEALPFTLEALGRAAERALRRRRSRARAPFLTHPVFNTLPLRDTRCCATCSGSRRSDLSLDALDDPARLLHDEAQRDRRDDPGDLAGVRRAASVRARRAGAGLRASCSRQLEALAGRDHRLRRRVAAAQRRARRASTPACSSIRAYHRAAARRTATSA